MKLSEGTVYGQRYYTVDPEIEAYEPYLYHQDWFDMENWCLKTFGSLPINGVWIPNARWYVNNSKFWFKEKKDLEWFILKWA